LNPVGREAARFRIDRRTRQPVWRSRDAIRPVSGLPRAFTPAYVQRPVVWAGRVFPRLLLEMQ
jgi:hypothetical protein